MAPEEPEAEWGVPAVNWESDSKGNGQVKVKVLNWKCRLEDADGYVASSYGNTPDDQNRVYTLKALENVPQHVLVTWVHMALGAEEVARIEQELADNIYLQQAEAVRGTVHYQPKEDVGIEPLEEDHAST